MEKQRTKLEAYYSPEQIEELTSLVNELETLTDRVTRLRESGVELGANLEIHVQANPEDSSEGVHEYGAYVGSSDMLMHIWTYALNHSLPHLMKMSNDDGKFQVFKDESDIRMSKAVIEFLAVIQSIAHSPDLFRRFVPVLVQEGFDNMGVKSLFLSSHFPEGGNVPPRWTQFTMNGTMEELTMMLLMGGRFEPKLEELVTVYSNIMKDKPENVEKLLTYLMSNYERKDVE